METLIIGESPWRIPTIIEIMKCASSNFHFFFEKLDVFVKILGVSDKNIADLKKDLDSGIINMEGLLYEVLYTWKRSSGDDTKLNILCQALTACHAKNIAEKLEMKFKETVSCASNVHVQGPSKTSRFSRKGYLHKMIENTSRLTGSDLKRRLHLVEKIMKRDPGSVNRKDGNNLMPLLVKSIHVELINLLLHTSSVKDVVDKQGCNFVHIAAKYLPSDQFEQLLQILEHHGLQFLLDKVDLDKKTPFFHLIWNNFELSSSVIEEIADFGINFNVVDKKGSTILSDAVYKKQSVSIMHCLVGNGSDFTWKNSNNINLLHVAAWVGHVEGLQYLLGLGLDINSRDIMLDTPLNCAVINCDMDCGLKTVNFLLENSADVNCRNKNEDSALSLAIDYNKDLEVIQALLAYGADCNWRDKSNFNLLHLAAFRGHFQAVKYLVEHGLDINSQDIFQSTPLMQSLLDIDLDKEKKMEIVKFLVEKNADIEIPNKDGLTALNLAKQLKLTDIFNFLDLKRKEKISKIQ